MNNMTKSQIVDQVLNGERIGSGLKDDIYHRSASSLSRDQLMNGKTTVFDGKDIFPYIKSETSGILNDIKGTFEYIINGKGQITHQLFKSN